jgi:CheY-like chemotaxis protein
MTTLTEAALRDQLHECLPHLYDFAFLQRHSLLSFLVKTPYETTRVQTFRTLITDAISQLHPMDDSGSNDRLARYHNILVLRYLKQRSVQQVVNALALSERQYYRDHAKAVEILSAILWERTISPENTPPDLVSVQTEIEFIREGAALVRESLQTVIDDAVNVLQNLLEAQGIKVKVVLSNEVEGLEVDRVIVRQFIMLIASPLALYAPRGSQLIISPELSWQVCVIRFELIAPDTAVDALPPLVTELEREESIQALAASMNTEITIALVDGAVQVDVRLPLKQGLILLIDDNPSIKMLFHRYLTEQTHQIISVTDGHQAIQMARKLQPNLILLDIMLPGLDGWEVLQNLKNSPETCSIPVLICSVLKVANLSDYFGADGFVAKPPGYAEFMALVKQWLD